jgi:hypothetical protein
VNTLGKIIYASKELRFLLYANTEAAVPLSTMVQISRHLMKRLEQLGWDLLPLHIDVFVTQRDQATKATS